MISEKFDGQVILDKLAKNLSDSIDTLVLYNAQGWTIVRVPVAVWPNRTTNKVHEWIDSHCGEYHYWDGQIAFKQAQDATMFTLRWL